MGALQLMCITGSIFTVMREVNNLNSAEYPFSSNHPSLFSLRRFRVGIIINGIVVRVTSKAKLLKYK